MLNEYSDDGVDLTLIRWMLSLTPGQRLAVLQDQVDSLLTLRAKFESQVPRNTESPDTGVLKRFGGSARFT